MAYQFVDNIRTIIQYTITDYLTDLTYEIVDLQSVRGIQLYKQIYCQIPQERISTKKILEDFYENDEFKIQSLQYIFSHTDERSRRLFAGYLSTLKGVKMTAVITGLSVKTIQKGQEEIHNRIEFPKNRIRDTGGGRISKIESEPKFLPILDQLIEGKIAGDPMSPKKWMRKTLKWCQVNLEMHNITVSPATIRKGLKKLGISLKKNRKYVNNRNHPDRNLQFNFIAKKREEFSQANNPIISIDSKKKEHIGNFYNDGQTWCKEPTNVLDHDFPSASLGKLIPYGVYDLHLNHGYVHCGVSVDTPDFAVDSIVWWWENYGKYNYSEAKKLLILCDAGGSNGYRPRKWKQNLQTELADKIGLSITVCHYPSGTSKYNPIEHRLFSYMTINWAGIPLINYFKALQLIRSTKTKTGLQVEAELTQKVYKKGLKVSNQEMNLLNIERADICPDWNYTIHPRRL